MLIFVKTYAMDSMYEVLMQLPLFKGVSYDCISKMITSTPFHFLKYPQGEVVVQPEELCTHIKFVISGSVRVTTTNDDGRFKLQQTLKAPDVRIRSIFSRPYPLSLARDGA